MTGCASGLRELDRRGLLYAIATKLGAKRDALSRTSRKDPACRALRRGAAVQKRCIYGSLNALHQLRTLAPTLVVVYGAGVVTLLLVLLAAEITGQPFRHFSRDPLSVGRGAEYYSGSLSSIGVLLWWTGAVAASLAACARRNDSRAIPLLAAGVLTGWLALDDLFLLHEAFFPRRGVSEQAVIAAYGLLAAAGAWLFRDFLRRSEWILLLSATGFLVASVVIDRVHDVATWEDSAKFLGIVGWTAFLVRAALFALTDRPARPGT